MKGVLVMKKDGGKEKIINMKTKIMSNIFKKIIACLVLIVMFSGYVVPVGEVLGNTAQNTAGSSYIERLVEEANEKLEDGKSFLSYSVPYFWGTVGFTYDPEKISEEEVSSWECLWNTAKYNKRFSLKDSVRDTYVPAIFHVYKDEIAALDPTASDYNAKLNEIFNRCDDATLAKVEAALKE